MADGFIVRRGGKSVNQAATPSINFVSKSDESITVTFTNNDSETATIVGRIDSLTAEGQSVSVASNATSANVTFAGLDEDTEFTIFATANVVGKTKSEPASTNITTNVRIFTAATGGTTNEYNLDGKRYKSHTFTSDDDFIVTTAGNGDRNQVDYLIIAGGGCGFGNRSGGGGAGGYRTTFGTQGGLGDLDSKITVTAKTYGIVVGAGGAGTAKNNGTASSFDGRQSTGGGAGGLIGDINGNTGGSGGGSHFNGTPGAGTTDQGFSGGNGFNLGSGGGGGGAGVAGQNGPANDTGGNGGDGLSSIIRTGSAEFRAGGGGGAGTGSLAGDGGLGGGGDGGKSVTSPILGQDGAVNTGSGGGGGRNTSNGGAGGSGIVIIRYEIAPSV
jgi:hypothetical protein